jgi:hypothetical protein
MSDSASRLRISVSATGAESTYYGDHAGMMAAMA